MLKFGIKHFTPEQCFNAVFSLRFLNNFCLNTMLFFNLRKRLFYQIFTKKKKKGLKADFDFSHSGEDVE